MNSLKYVFFLSALVLSMSSCFIDIDDDENFFGCAVASGPILSETYYFSDFSGIDNDMSFDITLTQGPVQEVVVEATDNVLDRMDFQVRNGILEIDTDGCITDARDVEVFITIPEINYLRIDGSGNITGTNLFVTDYIELIIDGSGDMDLGIEADEISATIDGSGDIKLEGDTEYFNLFIDGSGDVEAYNLIADEVDITVNGSGDTQITANERLNVRISGSGDVYYKGNPDIRVTGDGSGDVRNRN